MKKIIELLAAAEAEAKKLADAHPHDSSAQVLRARVKSAQDFAESPALAQFHAPSPKPETKPEAK